ncbi:uncharacterized protein LOC8056463 [Sorghum bicolor]|uniref:uncharacterized protein LOC8056463 n=1 Tax=Sorghum bicolor TaxID=4558 RepID=UPI000B423F85|nr:uncharacterized protein LOC8056463 [Sorghum bicolor]|eukprot:XP_021319679.1 uncharacterized protein LOC8056463 [Sorghum bicolor]
MDPQDQGEAMTENKTGMLALLPDDMLANILRRLPPRGLAMSRCVCKSWLAVINAHRLLRADLLPLSLAGFFMNFDNFYISEFLTPRSDIPSISGKQDYLPKAGSLSWGYIDGHCNGLVLVNSYDNNGDKNRYVLNPATRWLAPLPPCPPPPMEIKGTFQVEYLAYDPTESIDFEFEVVSITHFGRMRKPGDTHDHEIEQSEWPPSVFILDVFSSTTRQWEERSFAQEGNSSMGTVAGMRQNWPSDRQNAVYLRGALYVHLQNDCVMRISLSNDKYTVIKPPLGIEVEDYPKIYLGKSLITIWKHLQMRELNGPYKLLKMRNLHGALMMNMDAMVGTWRLLVFIHGKKLSS